jgi:hypothetical protein
MAKKGLSIPIVAEYKNIGSGAVKYTNPVVADAAVEYEVEVETGEDNKLWADNKVKETAAATFKSGTLTLTTADLTPEISVKIIGLKTAARTVNGKQVEEIVFDDDANPPELGFGIIEEHQVNGVTLYKPVILTRVRFKNPGNSATTREDEIEWQTQEITAELMRSDQSDDKYNHPWQISPKSWMATEDEAKAYILSVLGAGDVTDPEV